MKKLLSLVLALAILTAALFSLSSCGGLTEKDLAVGEGACKYLETRSTEGRDLKYVMLTVKDYGSMIILLDATTAPKTVENFLKLVNEGFYDGLTFHRIIDNFMIQGGCTKGDGTGGSNETIKGEFSANGHKNNISHKYGVISMARSSGDETNNYGRDSASSQFFICNADASDSLDGEYAAFGYVIAGLGTVDKITDEVFPLTDYYEYYLNYMATGEYMYYYYWNSMGNGALSNKDAQPVIARIIEITEEEAMSYVK